MGEKVGRLPETNDTDPGKCRQMCHPWLCKLLGPSDMWIHNGISTNYKNGRLRRRERMCVVEGGSLQNKGKARRREKLPSLNFTKKKMKV